MRDLVLQRGHKVTFQCIIPDEPEQIREQVVRAGSRADVTCLTGGTGISRRDRTVEAVSALFEQTLTGFGELFRMLSYQEIGSRAMLSRATAGVIGEMVVFALPGSPKAVDLAMRELIIPQAQHLAGELHRHRP